MQIYKEKENNFFRKQALNLEHNYGKQKDTHIAKVMVPKLLDAINDRKKIVGNLCDRPHDGVQDGKTFRLTRDVHGKDYCYFHEYSKNID